MTTNPIKCQLVGGVLDGDSFELTPLGSILPPMRLSYPYRGHFRDPDGTSTEHGCWLHYECPYVPQWTNDDVLYQYVGMEKMSTER